MQRLDFINEEMKKEHHAEQSFEDVDQTMKQYYYITGKQLIPLPLEPKLKDYYTPSSDQRTKETVFIVFGNYSSRVCCVQCFVDKNMFENTYCCVSMD